jgi:hypothetical protein
MLCGNGNTLVLKKVGQYWRVTRRCGGWVSQRLEAVAVETSPQNSLATTPRLPLVSAVEARR